MTGQKISTAIAALDAYLDGKTLVGTNETITLNKADDWLDMTGGTRACIDGGFTVLLNPGSNTVPGAGPSSSGGVVQEKWDHQIVVRVGYLAEVWDLDKLRADRIKFVEQLIDHIEACLQTPSSGSAYAVTRKFFTEPARQGALYVQDVRLTIQALWART